MVSSPVSPKPERLDLASVVEASEMLNASLDLDYILSNLLLVAMSRLLVGRGVVLLGEGEPAGTFRVAAAKGPAGVSTGDTLPLLAPADVAVGDAVPAALQTRGLALLIPIRHQRQTIGLVALGRKATVEAFAESEVAFARSLVGVAAAAIHNARVASRLQQVNLDLAARVHELNTLFELSQAFGAALDREEALKLLGYAVMGQLLAERHAVLLRPSEGGPLTVAASRGPGQRLGDDLDCLDTLNTPLLLESLAEGTHADIRALLDPCGFVLALPLRMQSTPRGVLLLGPRATGRAYGPNDVAFATALGTLALTAVENAALVESRIEKERLEEEMRLARTIQERLLPRALPDVPGVDLATLALASRHVAGDYFDCLHIGEGRVLVAIADVSGKGAPAALLMANLQAILHLLRQRLGGERSLAELTAEINRVVCENTEPSAFISFVWGVLHSRTGRFHYVNAGHNPPRLLRAEGSVERLSTGGLLLGVLPDAIYEEGTVTLEPGDALVGYTDGLTEARQGLEEYGEDRLDALLPGHAEADAQTLLTTLHADVQRFTGDAPLADDLTLVVLKRTA